MTLEIIKKKFSFPFFCGFLLAAITLTATLALEGLLFADEASSNPPLNDKSTLTRDLNQYLNFKSNPQTLLKVHYSLQTLNGSFKLSLNENDEFRPGSLLKLAVAIGYLKASEFNLKLLSQKIPFTDRALLKLYDIQSAAPSSKLRVGFSYSVQDLIKACLVGSDNIAAFLLENFDQRRILRKTIHDFDLSLEETVENKMPQFNFKNFSQIFRHLYQADYLNRQNSDLVLDYLKNSEFKEGLAFGIKVPVAHKYGESLDVHNSNIHFFNDCGIVFAENSPYSLCISIEGFHQPTLIKVAQELSQITYRHMSEK